MEALFTLLGLFLLVSPVGVVILFARVGSLRRRVDALRADLEASRAEIASLKLGPSGGSASPDAAPAETQPVSPAAAPSVEPAPSPSSRRREPLFGGLRGAGGLEEAIASRWMVWLGALAVALSAVFLFVYAVDQGWFGPRLRVASGLALGGGLVALSERVRRRDGGVAGRGAGPDRVAPALAGAGAFALYVSLYAAHGLYGLVGAAPAFAALALVSLATLALALIHGLPVAVLALAGGYLVPGLLGGETASAAPVFLYLFVLSAACLALMRWRDWWMLAAGAIAGGLGWPILWMAEVAASADQGVLGAYAVAMAAAFAGLSARWPVKRPSPPGLAWLGGLVSDTAGLGYVLSGALAILIAAAADWNAAGFLILAGHGAVGLVFGLRRAAFESLAAAAALVAAVAFLLWPPPLVVTDAQSLDALGPAAYAARLGPFLIPPEFRVFARALAGFAALFGLGGVLALRAAATPGVWAAIAAALPLWLLTLGYWRIGGFETDIGWATLAAGLALANFGAAAHVRRALPPDRQATPVAFFAAGATAALALGFACLLREAWLSVAIALEVPALVWIGSRLRVAELRPLILGLVAALVIRLVLNPAILTYAGGSGAFGWVIYGYGLPAAALALAARLLRREGDAPLAAVCETAALAFVVLMVSLQIRLWTAGALDAPRHALPDMGAQTLWWLIAAGALLRREVAQRLPAAWWGGAGLLALALGQIGFGHLLAANPLFTDEPVGRLPLVNLLGLAYLVPAAMLALLARDRDVGIAGRLRSGLWAGAAGLAFAWVTLEVRRAFHGPMIGVTRATSDAEVYAYSAVWIALALALLAVGVLAGAGGWRRAALAVTALTALKVFLYDLSDLTGLLRVASVLGLGLTLIGVGYVYRRFAPARPPAGG